MLVLVLVAGVWATAGPRPPWSLQPAIAGKKTGRKTARRPWWLHAAVSQGDDRPNPLLDSLRAAGILRQRVLSPVVGPRAYVKWWERVRAALVLAAIVAGLGVALAAAIGITVLGAGFLLEQAIS